MSIESIYVIVVDGLVVNAIVCDDKELADDIASNANGIAVKSSDTGIGASYDSNTLVFTPPVRPPAPPPSKETLRVKTLASMTEVEFTTVLDAAVVAGFVSQAVKDIYLAPSKP